MFFFSPKYNTCQKYMPLPIELNNGIIICVVCVGHEHFEDKHKTWTQALGLVTLDPRLDWPFVFAPSCLY